jgi:hypothetical protein
LAAVVHAWPMLPEAIRAGIVAMVKAALRNEGGGCNWAGAPGGAKPCHWS